MELIGDICYILTQSHYKRTIVCVCVCLRARVRAHLRYSLLGQPVKAPLLC